jgi:DNA repair helicase Rad3
LLSVKKLSSFTSGFFEYVDKIRIIKLERGDYPVCSLNGVLKFLEFVESSLGKSYVGIYRMSRQGFRVIEYRCLDPRAAIKPVVEEADGALIMSGTLSPLELFTEILGLEKAVTRTYSAIAKKENVKTIIDNTVTTKFTERNEKMIQRYGEKISKLVSRIPNGVLVFFPQKKFMFESLNFWFRQGILEKINEQSYLKGKRLFVEGSQVNENRRIVRQYKEASKIKKGAILCGVFRGRNAEGSNFPYEEARGVVLIGVPYANYGDPLVKAQIKYFNDQKKGVGEKWYVMDAFRAANQAIGRGIRHRDDWCNFLLLDARYQTFQKLLSNWVVASGVNIISI